MTTSCILQNVVYEDGCIVGWNNLENSEFGSSLNQYKTNTDNMHIFAYGVCNIVNWRSKIHILFQSFQI